MRRRLRPQRERRARLQRSPRRQMLRDGGRGLYVRRLRRSGVHRTRELSSPGPLCHRARRARPRFGPRQRFGRCIIHSRRARGAERWVIHSPGASVITGRRLTSVGPAEPARSTASRLFRRRSGSERGFEYRMQPDSRGAMLRKRGGCVRLRGMRSRRLPRPRKLSGSSRLRLSPKKLRSRVSLRRVCRHAFAARSRAPMVFASRSATCRRADARRSHCLRYRYSWPFDSVDP